MKKRVLSFSLLMTLIVLSCVGCGSKGSSNDSSGKLGDITVVSRETGSGTRGAFIELFGVEVKDAAGNKSDKTTEEAVTIQSTEVMMSTVSGNNAAIGYTSLGALNDSVKAVKIDGAEPTVANIKSKKYAVSRPFNIVTKATVSEAATDFINFVLSKDGQKVVEDNKYIAIDNPAAFTGKNPSGKIVIAGSSSVTPVMQKLIEAYKKVNPNLQIELQESDSTTGITAAVEGTCEIGMASRELKDTETAKGVQSTVIATDGIAVIVNKNNKIDNLTKDQVKSIYTGDTTSWEGLK